MSSAIFTERLTLRRLSADDAESMFAYRSDSKVAKYQDWKPESLDETREFIDGMSRMEPDTPDSWFQLALVERANDELVGDCGLHFFNSEPRQAEFGVTIAPVHQRRGYAAEAVQGVLEYLFVELQKHRVFASVDPRNQASIALLQSVGMRKEAHFVESLWFEGAWVDDVVFAILDREWRSRKQN